MNIRKFMLQAHELVALGTITSQAARFLEAAVAAGLNILISGGTQEGKTNLLDCLCVSIRRGSGWSCVSFVTLNPGQGRPGTRLVGGRARIDVP